MGIFGRGQEVQFFMSEKDQRKFLRHVSSEGIYFLMTNIFISNKPKLVESIPESFLKDNKEPIFSIFNSNVGKIELRFLEKWNNYRLIEYKSAVIDFLKSRLVGDTLELGRIAAMLSHYDYDENGKKIEKPQPPAFIDWWLELKKTITKNYTKCYLGPLRHSWPIWAGPDAVSLYEKGISFVQTGGDKSVTFHPNREVEK